MERSDWFESLTGFREGCYEETQSKFAVANDRLVSLADGRSWAIGKFEMTSLATLRAQAAQIDQGPGGSKVSVIQGDVRRLHAMPEFAGALFQVASQANALEMIDPEVTPEDGVTRYGLDRTQGPACALAAAPALIFRNFFVPIGDRIGQTRTRQLDGLAEVGLALGSALSRTVADLWQMRNGYALCTAAGLRAISTWLAKADDEDIDDLRGRLAIGLHQNVEVTEPDAPSGQSVSQVFCSALPVAYTGLAPALFRPFATLILEAAYEATMLAGVIQSTNGGSNVVLLTLLGGGAFGNPPSWIFPAMQRAIQSVRQYKLDIRIVSHYAPPQDLIRFVDQLQEQR